MAALDTVPKGAYPDFRKGMIAMRSWLIGKGYNLSLQAMALTKKIHTGTRKDGETPEFQHQMGVTYYLRTVHTLLMHPDETLAVGFLHDSTEDGLIRQSDVDELGSLLVSRGVRFLNKRGRTNDEYYGALCADEIASITKAADRMHNHQSMVGVFSEEKQRRYIEETTDYVLPMLKMAQEEWPRQHDAYENARHILKCQVDLVMSINGWHA